MRKKFLVLENNELKYSLEQQQIEIKLLKKKIDELNIIIGAKDSEINDLKNAVPVVKVEPEAEIEEITTPAEESPSVKTLEDKLLTDEINKYGAEIISKAARKTAEFIESANLLGYDNAGDVVTLALGKNELFKSKVFEAANSAIAFDAAKSSIDVLYAELNEYIEHLKSQN